MRKRADRPWGRQNGAKSALNAGACFQSPWLGPDPVPFSSRSALIARIMTSNSSIRLIEHSEMGLFSR
jgi:hypothetical protein